MDEHTEKLKDYIRQQLYSGQSPDEIAHQLTGAGWQADHIQQAFLSLQAEMVPTAYAPTPTAPATPSTESQPVHPRAAGRRRGRIRVGWQLFKQSFALLRGNRYLVRYLVMTGAWIVAITLVFMGLYLLLYLVGLRHELSQGGTTTASWLGYLLAFLDYVAVYFFINLYAAGLTANVLDIFQGKKQPYHTYMRTAWSKAPALFVFSVIAATVGMILQYVVERIRWVGWLLSWILGTMWSLGTLFVVPIIMTSENPSGVRSIRESVRFFKQTWGENITAKVSVNAPLFFLNLALMMAFVAGIFIGHAIAGNIGLLIVVILYVIAVLALAIIGSFANSLVNIALFYYAAYHEVPPAFSEDLLNHVFIPRKRRFFKKKSTQSTT